MNNCSDVELIYRFRDGQTQAFNFLALRWQKPIINFLYRYLGNIQDAEDACQRTFIKIYRKLSDLKDVNKFQVWLYQVAANQARDMIRHRKRQPFFSINSNSGSHSKDEDEAINEVTDPDSNDPETRAHQSQLQEIFKTAMQSIPEDQRLIVVMKIYQGLRFVEISDVLKIPINTVKSRMYYGLKALREVLKRQGFNEEVLNYEM